MTRFFTTGRLAAWPAALLTLALGAPASAQRQDAAFDPLAPAHRCGAATDTPHPTLSGSFR